MTITFGTKTIKDANDADVIVKTINDSTDGTTSPMHAVIKGSTGAAIDPATEGKQDTANAALETIATNTADAATATLQGAGNTLLAAIQTAVEGATPAGSNTIGSVSAASNTSGGASTYAALGGTGNALLTNSAVAVKASAGNLYGVDFVNTGPASAYVQFFDVAAGSVTLGTTVPKLAKWVPAGGAWEEKFTGEAKIAFTTAITVAATTTPTGNTAPGTGILGNIIYK